MNPQKCQTSPIPSSLGQQHNPRIDPKRCSMQPEVRARAAGRSLHGLVRPGTAAQHGPVSLGSKIGESSDPTGLAQVARHPDTGNSVSSWRRGRGPADPEEARYLALGQRNAEVISSSSGTAATSGSRSSGGTGMLEAATGLPIGTSSVPLHVRLRQRGLQHDLEDRGRVLRAALPGMRHPGAVWLAWRQYRHAG